MKTLIRSLVIFSLLTMAFGSAQAALKDDMQMIGKNFGALARQLGDPGMNADSAQKAAALVALFSQAINSVPSTIENLPPDQKKVALAKYKELIQLEIDLSTQLQKALEANDNASAVDIFNKIAEVRAEGHGNFKPPS